MTEEQIKQRADDFIITRQNHIKYFSGEAVKILLKNFTEEIVAEATKKLEKENKVLAQNLEDTEIINKALEKENAELKEALKGKRCNCMTYLNFKDLEKENAELKHTIATLRQEKDNVSMHAKAMEVVAKTRSDQLTKAKSLINRLSDYIVLSEDYWKAEDVEKQKEILKEVEQFLNSEVEK